MKPIDFQMTQIRNHVADKQKFSAEPTYDCEICKDTGFILFHLQRVIGIPYNPRWPTAKAIESGALRMVAGEFAAANPNCYSFARQCGCRRSTEHQLGD